MGREPTEHQRRVLMTGLAVIASFVAVHNGAVATAAANFQATVRFAPSLALVRW
jgi:hypothetical protein